MPAVSLTTVWAPVNCGYDSDHTYGLLYQWGRTDGGTYNKEWTNPSNHAAKTQTQSVVAATWTDGYTKNPKQNEFYCFSVYSDYFDWYTNELSKQLTEWPMTSPEGTSGIGNPCPEGWRVPTKSELNALIANRSWTIKDDQNGYYFSGSKAYSVSVPSVFLPAAGYRSCYDGSAGSRGNRGFYWSSSVSGNYAWALFFLSSTAYVENNSASAGRASKKDNNQSAGTRCPGRLIKFNYTG